MSSLLCVRLLVLILLLGVEPVLNVKGLKTIAFPDNGFICDECPDSRRATGFFANSL